MKKIIFNSNGSSWAATFSRVALGTVLFAHGAQKLLGWFGGFGFEGTMGFFTGSAGLPWIIGFLVIIIEFFGALSLIAGFATRIWSSAIAVLTLGIIHTTHWQHGFFMNWFGTQKGEGIEYFLLMLGIAVSLVLSGAGRYSVDALIMKSKPAKSYREHSLIGENAILA